MNPGDKVNYWREGTKYPGVIVNNYLRSYWVLYLEGGEIHKARVFSKHLTPRRNDCSNEKMLEEALADGMEQE